MVVGWLASLLATAAFAEAQELVPAFEQKIEGGSILDVDATRILWVNSAHELRIRDRSTHVDSLVATIAGNAASLVNRGAVWAGGESVDGVVTTNGVPAGFQAAGLVAAWSANYKAYYRNIETHATTEVVPPNYMWTTLGPQYVSVAGNGDAVFTGAAFANAGGSGVKLGYRQRLTSANEFGFMPANAVTDGIDIVYIQSIAGGSFKLLGLIQGGGVLTGPGNEGVDTASGAVVLGTRAVLLPHVNYEVNHGWIAFVRPGVTDEALWVREPGAGYTMLTTGTVSIDGLNQVGEVIFIRQNVRYLAGPNRTTRQVSSAYGAWRAIGLQWCAVTTDTLSCLAGDRNDGGASDASPVSDGGSGAVDGGVIDGAAAPDLASAMDVADTALPTDAAPDAGTTPPDLAPEVGAIDLPSAPPDLASEAGGADLSNPPVDLAVEAGPRDATAPVDLTADVGPARAPSDDSGCSCDVSRRQDQGPPALLAAVFAVGVLLRRRRLANRR